MTSPFKLLRVGVPAPSRLGHAFPPFDIASAREAGKLLDLNHEKYHCFFNESNFHNHFAHHILAAHQLGARPAEYPAIFEHAKESLSDDWKLNKKPTPGQGGIERITKENWTKHVGDRNHYWPYLEFFDHETRELGMGETLQRYVLSEEANKGGNQLLGRFVGGAIHPLIHCGYGAEFSLPGVMAEGLAMAMSTGPRFHKLFPTGWHDEIGVSESSSESSTPARMAKLKTDSKNSNGTSSTSIEGQENTDMLRASDGATASQPRSGLSVFSICTLAHADPRIAPGQLVRHDMKDKFDALLSGDGPAILESHMSRWRVTEADVADPNPVTGRGGWAEKYEELAWLNTLLLGATSRPGKDVRHDFFLMHSHNATLFLPSLLPLLEPWARSKLLHATWRITFAMWIARGRAPFEISETLKRHSANPLDPGKKITFEDGKEGKPLAPLKERNAWYDVAEAAVNHGDEHAMKALRAQMHFATSFASTQPGDIMLQPEAEEASKKSKDGGAFRGLEQLDGSAFARTAGQLLVSQGWRHDGGFHWDFNGPGFDETWADDAANGRQ